MSNKILWQIVYTNFSIWPLKLIIFQGPFHFAFKYFKSYLSNQATCMYTKTGPEEAICEWSGQILACLQVWRVIVIEVTTTASVCIAHSAVRKHKHARGVWGHAPQENFEKLDT